MKRICITGFFFLFLICSFIIACNETPALPVSAQADCWRGAGIHQIPVDSTGRQVRYGLELVANTAAYLGPEGTVLQISNGMNCQNCHLEAGTKPWGNNFGAVAANYPKYRPRSGTVETIEKRVNDCIERSLNGKPLDTTGREMKAIVSYIRWLGSEIPKGTTPKGSGIMQLHFLERPADPQKGKIVYMNNCSRCHGTDGMGQRNTGSAGYAYPPLWGANSYNEGAGLFRLSRLAGFVKNNMPDPANYHTAVLSDEEAWDVAAFINSQPRPAMDISKDWPDISKKPFDHPFGPYSDSFSVLQHKYGPFGEIKKGK